MKVLGQATRFLAPGVICYTPPSQLAVPFGLLGYWGLDADCLSFGATTAFDISGNARHGTLASLPATSLANGQVGQALTFNGTSSSINLGNSAALNPTAGISLIGWFYNSTTDGTVSWMIGRDDNTLGRSFALGFDFGAAELQINGGIVISVAQSGAYNNIARWTHFAVTGDPTHGYVMYINGSSIGTGSWTAPGVTTGNTTIGQRTYSGFQGFWNGTIDDVRMYNRALSPSEISQLYQIGLNGRRDSGEFTFDAGVVSTPGFQLMGQIWL